MPVPADGAAARRSERFARSVEVDFSAFAVAFRSAFSCVFACAGAALAEPR